jgi:hypothetical protein
MPFTKLPPADSPTRETPFQDVVLSDRFPVSPPSWQRELGGRGVASSTSKYVEDGRMASPAGSGILCPVQRWERLMGFYIRKSVKAGPFRLNLSKSGIGVSAGIPGLRVGAGPRGTYVHMGGHGVYYRQTLSPTEKSTIEPASATHPSHCPFDSAGARTPEGHAR